MFTAGLLDFLVRFFRLQQVAVCSDDAESDLDLADTAIAVVHNHWIVANVNNADPNLPKSSLLVCNQIKYSWLMEEETNVWLTDAPMLTGQNLTLSSTIVSHDAKNKQVEEYYAVKGKLLTNVLGTWDPIQIQGFKVKASDAMWERRSDLQGMVIKASVLPWNFMSSRDEDGKWRGFLVEVLEVLGQGLNFTLQFSQPKDGKYGKVSRFWPALYI